ncbi:MAG: Homocitrate synthase [bacterium ADurb.Bin400]|nr:MAG: Homocitrate synthase [bacterium ADurb.Bin400]
MAKLGFHGHNDRGRGVSNAELAFLFGIRHIQGTINGYGERCGNTDLCTLIPNLYFDYRAACLMNGKLERLTDLSRMTAEFVNAHHRSNHPWVGHLAGHTEAGMHASGEGRDPGSYLHADLTLIGNRDSYGVSEQSGRSNIFAKAKELGFELSAEEIAKVTDLHNRRLAEGYSYAAADASLHLLIMEALGLDHSGAAFTLEGWHVDTNRDGANLFTEATIRASLDNVYAHEVGSGDGPVDALNSALRKVLDRFYPELPKWKLSDYKVRIVNPQAATAAKVRVLIETSDKQETWTTVGVHENIIEASWIALVQSVAYAIHRNGKA